MSKCGSPKSCTHFQWNLHFKKTIFFFEAKLLCIHTKNSVAKYLVNCKHQNGCLYLSLHTVGTTHPVEHGMFHVHANNSVGVYFCSLFCVSSQLIYTCFVLTIISINERPTTNAICINPKWIIRSKLLRCQCELNEFTRIGEQNQFDK